MDINAQRRMLELAGMSHIVLTEAKKPTVKEDAAQSLEQKFGSLGRAVIDTLESYKGMAIDPDMAGELNTGDMAPKTMEGYVEDMINDQLGEIYESAEYKQLCTEMMGQHAQISAEPEQGVLDV
jgi:hypothetical protein